jgi:chorismate mutase
MNLSIVTALAGFIGGFIGSSITAWTTRSVHRERLAAEQKLAERKYEFDKDLAEKRLAYDKALVVWRRRHEIAEQILTATYEARDIINWVRTRVIMAGEGESRAATEPEEEKLRKKRNAYFVPIERLNRETKTLSRLHALQYAAGAHFGEDIIEPLFKIINICVGIASAARILIHMAEAEEDRAQRESLMRLREELGWGTRPDATDSELGDAVTRIEVICRPVLSEKPPG